MIVEWVFWISFLCILHSYVLFPLILNLLAKGKKQNRLIYLPDDDGLPVISILLAVYNEESVIEEKIKSTFNTGYPLPKIHFYIGSDASVDRTNEIIKKYQDTYGQLYLKVFPGRTGKSGIINDLAENAKGEIFVLTDANVFFTKDTLYQLVKHYKNQEVAQVGGNIINPEHKQDGISFQEKSYLTRENLIKYQEGIIWGCMIGAFGGCYSIRAGYFAPVPPKFLMDDFYISMHVLEQRKKALNELDAHCYEDVSNKIKEEFRRKLRISAGNFQNLSRYKHLLWPPFTGLAFSFLSHKVLRWYGPVFILLLIISNIFLMGSSNFYRLTMFLQLAGILVPFIDYLLKKINIHFKLFRFVTHFYLMNLALFQGFIWYLRGVQSNVWKPTQRNQ